MTNPFSLGISRSTGENSEAEELKNHYRDWRTFNRSTNAPFFPLDNHFKDAYLKDIEGGPLRLYLYFAFHAKNKEGFSFHSVNSIAEFFGTKTRTIDNWIKSLVDAGLIYRQRDGRKTTTTFLLPLSSSVRRLYKTDNQKTENQEMVDYFVQHLNEVKNVYGELTNVLHLFQWKQGQEEDFKGLSRQAIAFLTKRNDIYTLHLLALKEKRLDCVNDIGIDENKHFISKFQWNNSPILGIAYPSTSSISAYKHLKNVLQATIEISKTSTEQIIETTEEVKYGPFRNELIEQMKSVNEKESEEK